MKKLIVLTVLSIAFAFSYNVNAESCLWDAQQGDCDDSGDMFCSAEPGECQDELPKEQNR